VQMLAWSLLIVLSGLVGGLTARFLKRPVAIVIGAGAAWWGMLAYLLFDEYVLPYRGGGASMWPVAQLFGGTVAAACAAVTATAVVGLLWARSEFQRQQDPHKGSFLAAVAAIAAAFIGLVSLLAVWLVRWITGTL
jgi:hypothetical protein